MGGLFGSKSTTTSDSTTNTGPSTFQQPYLTQLFNGAQSDYTSSQGTPYYQGETYAGMTDAAKATLGILQNYASTTGLGSANTLTGMGNTLSGAAGQALSTQNQFAQMAGQDGTDQIVSNAGKYINNDVLNGQIDAANRDVGRTLNEQTLPGIDRQASAAGSINSSRAGIAAGVAQRGAADQMADTAASLRGAAYNQGLSLSQQAYQNQMASLGNAAQGYSALAGQGASALTAGTTAGLGAYGAMTGADTALQADQQGKDTDALTAWQNQDTRSYDLNKRYQDLVGSTQWGTSGTTSGTTTASTSQGLGSSILGAAMGGVGLATGLGWKPFGK